MCVARSGGNDKNKVMKGGDEAEIQMRSEFSHKHILK
jgi:hypothetical protein